MTSKKPLLEGRPLKTFFHAEDDAMRAGRISMTSTRRLNSVKSTRITGWPAGW